MPLNGCRLSPLEEPLTEEFSVKIGYFSVLILIQCISIGSRTPD